MATTCVVYDDDDCPGQTVVGDEDETTKYEEDDDDGVVGSGRRGIAVLVTESSSSDNVDADFDDGHLRLAGVTRRAVINRRIFARAAPPAMAVFTRIVIKRKVQRKVQMIWS